MSRRKKVIDLRHLSISPRNALFLVAAISLRSRSVAGMTLTLMAYVCALPMVERILLANASERALETCNDFAFFFSFLFGINPYAIAVIVQ